MSEVLKEVLVNKAARSGSAKQAAVASAAQEYAPWGYWG